MSVRIGRFARRRGGGITRTGADAPQGMMAVHQPGRLMRRGPGGVWHDSNQNPPDVNQFTSDSYGRAYKGLGLFKGIQNGRCRWSVREIPMINPFHLLLGSRPYLRAAIQTSVLIVGSLSCFAASAQTYPISGVWVAMDQRFPVSKTGACLTLKTLGVDALFDGPFPTVMIFSVGERFVVRGGRSAELAIRSVKSAKDGGFHITESLGKFGGWLPWFKNRALHLKVLDPMVIEVTEGPFSTRFFKCSFDGRSL